MPVLFRLMLLLGALSLLAAQQPGPTAAAPAADNTATEYKLGPDDEVIVRAVDVEEIGEKPFRLDGRGEVNIPLIGRVTASGLTPRELEAELVRRLKTYLHDPQVTVAVTQFRSQPVSILGAVNKPGVNQIEAGKTLFEVLSLAGGLRPDAGNTIKITRRKDYGSMPLAGAQLDPTGQFTVGQVSVKSIMEARSPADNILIRPFDVISVPRAEVIYVVGSVRKPGGFVLGERERLSVLQALALAEGLDKSAAPSKARILRALDNSTSRTESVVDLKKILNGKSDDVLLAANDILFVPSSGAKNIALRSLEAAFSIGTGVIIYR
ncbi:MAG TPA: polysaccharide biosynthesis/export family protein [Bryobacteraceae bacterium]|nr:polysaccharide biosynthesis/export family protein [Bryobacteraceae bacterium]